MSTKCSSKQIERVGYTYHRKTSKKAIKVSPTCITDRGKPGKGPILFKIPKEDIGLLGKYGYNLDESHDKRIAALKKANKENSHLKVLRHLNALRTLQKSNEKIYNKLNRDMKWLQQHYTP
jgi:hypothetical protein